ncbi:Poly [ADP-ribose] polymerase 2 [Chytridiales sp. JEL 0842]|nr:Poly [ADP-ribose] polymerase 2 [Chytridiales sp. JEL 0842]
MSTCAFEQQPGQLNYLIADEEDISTDKKTAKVKSCQQRADVTIVSADFISECVKAGKLVSSTKFLLTSATSNGAAPADGTEASKAAKEEKEVVLKDEKPAKKRKVEAEPGVVEDLKEKPVVEEVKHVTVIKKGRAAVDSGVSPELARTVHVYEANGVVYDAMLNQTNIGNNNNKFYVIQVLKHDNADEWIVWNRWGRVDYTGQNTITRYYNPSMAIAAFEEKFKAKTANDWADRENFVKKPNKYYLLERDWGDEELPEDKAKKEETKIEYPDSTLAPPVQYEQDLIKLIFNLELMEREMAEIGYDAKKMPLGKLTKAHIEKGYLELKKIAEEIQKPSPSRPLLEEYSNNFYTIIPHSFGFSRPPIIKDPAVVKRKLEMLESLADIQITTTLLSSMVDTTVNPIDQKYKSLQCNLQPMDKSSHHFRLIEEYMQNTHGHTHSHYKLRIEDVFELERSDLFHEKGANMHNKKLLWHGSRITNFVGILSQGLRIAPPEAPVTGYMFGKGVYFADMVSKSANYCCTSRSNPTGLLLLCEVALGDEVKMFNADYNADAKVKKAKKHSTWGMGRTMPDPSGYKTLENGVVVPCGKAKQSTDAQCVLEYNEFIIYDISQVRLRYLIKTHFDYTK